MLMVKYTAEQTLTSNNPPEIAGDPFFASIATSTARICKFAEKQKNLDNLLIIKVLTKSGWLDSNQRPHAPQTRTLTGLSYIPLIFVCKDTNISWKNNINLNIFLQADIKKEPHFFEVHFKKWRWQCGTVALLATTGTLVPQRSALGYYSPTNAARSAVYAVPAAGSHAKHRKCGAAWGATRRHCKKRGGHWRYYAKKRALAFAKARSWKKWRWPTLPQTFAVPSALSGLTSLFGMGRGGSPTLSIALISVKRTLTVHRIKNIYLTNQQTIII